MFETRIFAAIALAGLFGCGDVEAPAPGAELQGIYAVERFTTNPTSCEGEGPAVLTDDRDHLVAFEGRDAGGRALLVVACADPGDCRARRTAGATAGQAGGAPFDFSFQTEQPGGLEGVVVTTGAAGPVCTGAARSTGTLRRTGEGRLRVEVRSIVSDHAPDEEGRCTVARTEREAPRKRCSRLQVVEARRIEPL
jgi:hypothetical protein